MRVSIIIPTYNRARLLLETIDSVFAQTFRDYEAIVVDDGSTDDTARALERVKDRITYHRIAHAGQGAARNAGLELACGEYIAFLDSDDLWDARFLEIMTQALEAAPRAGFVYCDYALFDFTQGMIECAYLPPRHKLRGSLFAALLEEDFISTGALLIRRACFDRVGMFDPRLPPVEDWDMWLRLARVYDAEYVDQPLTHIRANRASASRNPEIIYPLNLRVLAKLQREFPDDARRFRPTLRRQTARFHRALANYFRATRRPALALKHAYLMVSAQFV